MTGGSLGLRTGSYGSLQQGQNGVLQTQNSFIVRKSSRMSLSGSREKERFLPLIYRYFGRRKVGMLILAVFALLAFLTGFITVHKEEASESSGPYIAQTIQNKKNSEVETVTVCGDVNSERPPIPNPFSPAIVTVSSSSLEHPCRHFQVPPPPPGG